MTHIAVVAHKGKSIGGGLDELEAELRKRGAADAKWHVVKKSKYFPDAVRDAVGDGAELVIAWGGDGSVQRCLDTLQGSDVRLAVIPAGTGNLFATNLGIPKDVPGAVDVALRGNERRIDLGRVNGEAFGVMAGAGLDARMIRDADGGLKDALGRLAYVWTGARNLRKARFKARIDIDGERWFKGKAGCVLVGNMGELTGGITAFPKALPDDGCLDVGVITADSLLDWTRALARTATGHATESPFVKVTRARKIDVRMSKKVLYELDGGDRDKSDRMKVRIKPGAIVVKVP